MPLWMVDVPSRGPVPARGADQGAAAQQGGWPKEMSLPVLLSRNSPVWYGELCRVVLDVFPRCPACQESPLSGPGRIPVLVSLPHVLEPQFPLVKMGVVSPVCEARGSQCRSERPPCGGRGRAGGLPSRKHSHRCGQSQTREPWQRRSRENTGPGLRPLRWALKAVTLQPVSASPVKGD